jgi:hypothetical protein
LKFELLKNLNKFKILPNSKIEQISNLNKIVIGSDLEKSKVEEKVYKK